MTTPPDRDELTIRARLVALVDGPSTPAAQSGAVDAAAASAERDAAAGDWWDALYADDTQGTHRTAGTTIGEVDAQPADERDPRRIQPWWSGRHSVLAEPEEGKGEDGQEQKEGATTVPAADAQPVADDTRDEVEIANTAAADAQPKRRFPQLRNRIHVSRILAGGYTVGPDGGVTAVPAPRMSLLEAGGSVPRRVRWLILHASAAGCGAYFGLVQWSTRTAAWFDEHGYANANGAVLLVIAISAEAVRSKFSTWRLPVRWLTAIPISSIVAGQALYGVGWQNLEFPL